MRHVDVVDPEADVARSEHDSHNAAALLDQNIQVGGVEPTYQPSKKK